MNVTMKKWKLWAGVMALAALVSCQERHFISDALEREEAEADFNARKEALGMTEIFDVFNREMAQEEREAMMFLYAYMPVSDLADHSGDYHLANVRCVLQARQEMPWGQEVPEREFRHFVLPPRVNNEILDDFRTVCYDELKERVQGLSLHDAVLEVNHWCHEKATYAPSDARTSSPLATIRTAYGRCGEESTLLVAALRTVGIPARQVYTPRWAHTDDNHAWVEAWVDGKWHFMGACEPEPVLDLGWFNAPAARGMLMHTKVFGKYHGPEEVIRKSTLNTEINVTSNYAETAQGQVRVVDAEGQPVDSAKVEFKLYNYAEFCTVVVKHTDKKGQVSLAAGKGDMLAWASKGGKFGFGKLSFGKDKEITIKLEHAEGDAFSLPLDIVPPVEKAVAVAVTPEQRKENDRRFAYEDSLRNAYMATFMTKEQAEELAAENGTDKERTVALLLKSRGNHAEIARFIAEAPAGKKEAALSLLENVSEKDLRDAPASVLADHLLNTPSSIYPSAYFDKYVQNPRVAYEALTPYKSFLQQDTTLIRLVERNPGSLIEWCNRNITVNDGMNDANVYMSPEGVWKTRVTDARSRDVFFVAVLRAAGVPARIDEVTSKVQFATLDGIWLDVSFSTSESPVAPSGQLVATYRPAKALENPLYYYHYTLSRFDNGTFRLMNYPEDASGSWKELLSKPLRMAAGYYMLTTGTRLASGSVLSQTTFFTVKEGETTRINLTMRDNPDVVKVIGNLNSEALFRPAGGGTQQSLLSATGRGYYVVGVLGVGQEPTNHALRDIAAVSGELEEWGRNLVLLWADPSMEQKFREDEFPGLPSTIVWGADIDGNLRNEIIANMNLKGNVHLPLFVIADTFNRVVFVSQGYTIGLGEQLLKVIRQL